MPWRSWSYYFWLFPYKNKIFSLFVVGDHGSNLAHSDHTGRETVYWADIDSTASRIDYLTLDCSTFSWRFCFSRKNHFVNVFWALLIFLIFFILVAVYAYALCNIYIHIFDSVFFLSKSYQLVCDTFASYKIFFDDKLIRGTRFLLAQYRLKK